MRGFVLVLLTALADYVVLQGTARLQPIAAPYNGALDKNGSAQPPTLPPHLRDNRIYHITSAPIRLRPLQQDTTSTNPPIHHNDHFANRRLVDVDTTDIPTTTTTTFDAPQPTTTTTTTTTTTRQQQPTTTETIQLVTSPTEVSRLVSQPQPITEEPPSTSTTTTTTQRPQSTTTTSQAPSSTTTTTTTQRPQPTTTSQKPPPPTTTTTKRPRSTSRRPLTTTTTTTQRPSTVRMPTTMAAATAMKIEAPKAPSQHSIEIRSGPDSNKLQKCPRSEDIHPCECVEVATPSEVLGEEGSRAEYEVETVAFCKNIRNVDVLREGLRGMQGHHMTYLVLDSVHLPPFPNDLFKNVGVGWMEVLNSTMQFQKQFFQCYEKGCT